MASTCLLGCIVRTPSAWGLVVQDNALDSYVHVVLNWTLAIAERTDAIVWRGDILERSFCPIGQCVDTEFGSGVLLDFRCEDRCHVVRLWQPRGRRAGTLYCQARALRRVLAGAVGFPATTPWGIGIVRAVDHADNGTLYRVELDDGQGEARLISVTAESMQSPAAATLPVAESFGQLAERELAKCMRKVSSVAQKDLADIDASALLESASDMVVSAATSSAPGTVIAGSVQRVSQHLGLGQRVSERLGLGQAENQETEEGAPHRDAFFQSTEVKALTDKLQDTQMGHVLLHGAERLREHALAIHDAGTPQVDRLKLRACELASSLTAEEVLRDKAQHLLIGAWHVVDAKLAQFSPLLATEAGNLTNMLASHCSGIVQQCGQLLSVRVELGLAGALAASDADPALAGAELLDRFRMIGSEPSQVASVPAGQTLAMLDALGLQLPATARDTLARDASQPLDAAVVTILDSEALALRAEGVLRKGEAVMDSIHNIANSTIVAGVLENLESAKLESELLDSFNRFDADAFLQDADKAITDREARETFVNQLLDVCLDFVLRTLPSVRIPQVSGSHLGTSFQVHDLDMSGLRFQKEDVHISMRDLKEAGTTCSIDGEVELFQLHAQRVSGQFSELQCKVKPPLLPEASILTSGIASGIEVHLSVAAKHDSDTSNITVRISQLSVRMSSLELKLSQSSYARLFNPLVGYLNEFLMGYICGVLESQLTPPLSNLCTHLSELLTEMKPLLAFLGWPPRPHLQQSTSLVML